MYFRFFLPEEYYCHPVVVSLRPHYGSPALLLSSKTAYPDFLNYGWRQVWLTFFLVFFSFSFSRAFCGIEILFQGLQQIFSGFGYGQVTLCPIIHEEYTVGTYAGAVYGVTSSSFRIEVTVAKLVCLISLRSLGFPFDFSQTSHSHTLFLLRLSKLHVLPSPNLLLMLRKLLVIQCSVWKMEWKRSSQMKMLVLRMSLLLLILVSLPKSIWIFWHFSFQNKYSHNNPSDPWRVSHCVLYSECGDSFCRPKFNLSSNFVS